MPGEPPPDAFGNPGVPQASAAAVPLPPDPVASGPEAPGWAGAPPPPAPSLTTDGFAIAALVLSIVCFLLFAIVFAFLALGRIKKGKTKGKGLAIAALVISGLWIVIIAVAIAVTPGHSNSDNASRFSGEKARVARVVDRFANTIANHPGAACSTLTPELRQAVAVGSGKLDCVSWAKSAIPAGEHEVGIKIQAIRFVNPTVARVTATEGGSPISLVMRQDSGAWKIASIGGARQGVPGASGTPVPLGA